MAEDMNNFESLIRKLPKTQRAALDAIALGDDRGHHPQTCEALERKGLIEMHWQTLPGVLPVRIRRYTMPIPVHIAWCNVCAAEFDALSPEEQAAMKAPDT